MVWMASGTAGGRCSSLQFGILDMCVVSDLARSPLGFMMLVWPLGFRMLSWPLMGWKASARDVSWYMMRRRGEAIGVMLGKSKGRSCPKGGGLAEGVGREGDREGAEGKYRLEKGKIF